MTGNCGVCGAYTDDIAACPDCGQPVGLCCWSFKEGCCIQCKVDKEDEAHDL